ncbi:MAG: hypothetical protein N3A57_00425 [Negativicutes bacterium]|nr:hypothetical protein [Negativicutes bacterium]
MKRPASRRAGQRWQVGEVAGHSKAAAELGVAKNAGGQLMLSPDRTGGERPG